MRMTNTIEATVRLATAGETAAIMPLYEWLFAPPGRLPVEWDPEAAERRLADVIESDAAVAIVAERNDGRIAGVCVAYLDLNSVRFGMRVWVEDLVVAPDDRSQGIGGRLMDAARQWARNCGATHLEVDTGEARVDAQRFYARQDPEHSADRLVDGRRSVGATAPRLAQLLGRHPGVETVGPVPFRLQGPMAAAVTRVRTEEFVVRGVVDAHFASSSAAAARRADMAQDQPSIGVGEIRRT